MRRGGLLCGLVVLIAGAGVARASTVIGLSVEDQARLSQLVVVGEVVSQRGVVHPSNGIETAVTLRVTDVLKGDIRPSQSVVFHTRGGQVDGEISEALGEAVFQPGQKVLVFIESVEGRRYNLGLSMGVFDAREEGAGGVTFMRALRDGLVVLGDEAVEQGPISFDEMRAKVSYAGRHPRFDNEMLRSQPGQGR